MVENEAWLTPSRKASRAVRRGPNSLIGRRSVMDLSAVRTPGGEAWMLRPHGRCGHEFQLLGHVGFMPRKDQDAAAVLATVEGGARHDRPPRAETTTPSAAHVRAVSPWCASCQSFRGGLGKWKDL
jgi:hypothetical protein